jgi:hypothetical protein
MSAANRSRHLELGCGGRVREAVNPRSPTAPPRCHGSHGSISRRWPKPRAGLAWLAAASALAWPSMPLEAAAPAPGPAIELSVVFPEDSSPWNGVDVLIIRASLQHPGALDDAVPREAIVLAPAGKAWPWAVALAVTGPDGRAVDWPFDRSGPTGTGPFSLTLHGRGSMGFTLPADPQRTVAPGRYTLRATMEIRDGPGWRGRSESPPLVLEVTGTARETAQLQAAVAGAEAFAPGDPLVVAVEFPPLPASVRDQAVRSGFTLTVHDANGRGLPWKPEGIVGRPWDFEAGEIKNAGAGPLFAVFPGEATRDAPPGGYSLKVDWSAGAAGLGGSTQIEFTVLAAAAAAAHPARNAARVRQHLALATALVWQAERSPTAEIERLTARAAAVLAEANRIAVAGYLAQPRNVEAAVAVAEVHFLQGDYEGARAFAEIALSAWRPPAPAAGVSADPQPPMPSAELRAFRQVIEDRARRNPGRALPCLQAALTAAHRGAAAATGPVAAAAAPARAAPAAVTAPTAGAASAPTAQWATSARASSEYRATDYSARQATGAPDVARHGDSGRAWAPKAADGGEEWLELAYARPVFATGVRVVQNFNPGAAVRIDVVDETGAATAVWQGPDVTAYAKNTIGVLEAVFPATSAPVARIRLVLDTKRVSDWNEIDAVELLGSGS